MIRLWHYTALWSSLAITTAVGQSILANGTDITSSIPSNGSELVRYCGNSTTVCPACDNECITSARGSRYRVYCDTFITWNATFRQSNIVTAGDCMEACDRSPGCLGILSLPDGTCELASGSSLSMDSQTNFTAFVLQDHIADITASGDEKSAGMSTLVQRDVVTPPTNMPPTMTSSWGPYSTGPPTGRPTESPTGPPLESPTGPPTGSYTEPPTGTMPPTGPPTGPPSPDPSGACNASAALCPDCEAYVLTSNANQTYMVECTAKPKCGRTVDVSGWFSQDMCLDHCDADPQCLVAIQDKGRCILCDDSLGDEAEQITPSVDYLIYVLESPKTAADSYGGGQNSSDGLPESVNGSSVSTTSLYGTSSSQVLNATAVP